MKNQKDELRAGDLVKKWGTVRMASGEMEKLSKKTWVAGEQDGKLGLFLGDAWEPLEDVTVYVVVGSVSGGLKKEHLPADKFVVQGVFQKYRLLKDVPKMNWKQGEVVKTNGKVVDEQGGEKRLTDTFEWVADNVPHQHLHVVVDPIVKELATKAART